MSAGASSQQLSQDNSTITSSQLAFNFGNLCGSPYSGGSIVFSSDGSCLFSPVSNRVLVTDLSSNRSSTARPEMRSTTDLIVTMPEKASKFGRIVLVVDVDGYGVLLESISGVVLSRINFKGRVRAAAFSLDGKYLATAVGRRIKVWHSACTDNNWQFVIHRQFAGHIGDVNSLQWAPPVLNKPDLLVSAGSDSIVRVWSLNFEESPHSILNDHTQSIVGAYFFAGRDGVVAVNASGTVISWKRMQGAEFEVSNKAHIQSGIGYVTCSSFDSFSGILCLGLSGGAFSLYEIPSMQAVQSLSVGAAVTSVAVANGGDWIAVGVEEAGQLIVWEWRAENFILKQQGHHDGVNCVAFCPVGSMSSGSYSSDLMDIFGGSSGVSATFNAGGGLMATGGVEGKVKLWHSLTGFCFVTLADHTSSVEALAFTPQGNAIVSASMDGSVRAYDLLRYKNFRTFTAPDARVQFGSLAIDPSGDIIAAGAANGSYNIYLWATKTGQCVDILPGHEARISYLRFAPSSNDGILASASWDSSLKVWNVFANKNKGGVPESLMNQREVTCCAFDPIDGTIAAVASLSGHITFWDTRNGIEVGSIDGIRDIGSGRKEGEKFSSGALKGKRSRRDGTGLEVNLNQYFSALQYGGAAGRWLAAVSKSSAFVCIYDPLEKVLVTRIELTTNFGLSGVKQFLNSKFDTDLVTDDYDELDRTQKRMKGRASAVALPGVARGDMKSMSSKRIWRVNGIAVSPDGQEVAVATSEGAYVLTLASGSSNATKNLPVAIQAFNPANLTEEISKATMVDALTKGDSKKAVVVALSLNDVESFQQVFDAISKPEEISSCVAMIPKSLLTPLLRNLAALLHPVDGTNKIERCMSWITLLIQLQFATVQQVVHQTTQGREIRAILCGILQHVQTQSSALGNLLRENSFALGFLTPRGFQDEDDEEEDTPVSL